MMKKNFSKKNKSEGFAKHYRFNKHFLYKLILHALHAFHAGKTAEAEIREQLHYIDILTEKGLFDQAREIIISTKEKAKKYQFSELSLELMHKELFLYRETSFAGTTEESIESIFTEMHAVIQDLNSRIEQETITVRISQRLTKGCFVRSKKSLDEMFGLKVTSKLKKAPGQFSAAWNFYTSKTALSFMNKDYEQALIETNALISLVEEHPHMVTEMPKSYINVLHNKIVLLNNLHLYKEVAAVAEKIEAIPVKTQILKNRKFYSSHNLLLSMYPMTGEFEKGLALIKVMEGKLSSGEVQFNIQNQHLTHSFSCACVQFCAGNYIASNKYLQELIDMSDLSPRADILAFARILRIMVQFEMGKQDLLEYTVRSAYRFLYKRKRLYKFEDIILRFIRKKAPNINSPAQTTKAFKELHDELIPLTKDPFEKNAFAYLDIISWLESKIYGKPFASILKEKAGITEKNKLS